MKIEDVSVGNYQRENAGTLFTPDTNEQRAVLLVHGYDSSRRGYAEYAESLTSQLGAVCLTIDLAGHGDSAGDREEIAPV